MYVCISIYIIYLCLCIYMYVYIYYIYIYEIIKSTCLLEKIPKISLNFIKAQITCRELQVESSSIHS